MKWVLGLIRVILIFAYLVENAQAIDLTTLYQGSCNFDTGIILKVDNRNIHLLTLAGQVKTVPRYEILAMADHPLSELPAMSLDRSSFAEIDLFIFYGFHNGETIEITRGWPIGYNKQNIYILSTKGEEYLLRRSDIWDIEIDTMIDSGRMAFNGKRKRSSYLLRHPVRFESCAKNLLDSESKTVITLLPQNIIDDPIQLKRQHDHLQAGLAKLRDYDDRKSFYAVPFYYKNETRLGTWAMMGSRYSNVGARKTNLLPLVIDELADGPFGFQRVVKSGVTSIDMITYEEPIAQVFYGLKADYIHLDFFFDPFSPLIGDRYRWSKERLNSLDDRIVENGGGEFGVDIGYVSVFFGSTMGHLAVRHDDYFANFTVGIPKVGFSFRKNKYVFKLYSSEASGSESNLRTTDEYKMEALKMMGTLPLWRNLLVNLIFIDRKTTVNGNIKLESQINTFASEWKYDLNYRWQIQALVSYENIKIDSFSALDSDSKNDTKNVIKVGSGVTIAF